MEIKEYMEMQRQMPFLQMTVVLILIILDTHIWAISINKKYFFIIHYVWFAFASCPHSNDKMYIIDYNLIYASK